ncbi:MAG: hypothetical protein HOP15_02350 [Planctomycetes bacterium]|nr:hypothetical protein [Planctomycetota bacterium]
MSQVSDLAARTRDSIDLGGVDFDLGGAVGLRLIDAGSREIAAVTRQLGPIRRPLARAPDVVVRFVERLSLTGPLRYIGLVDAAFSDDEFLLLRGKHESRLRVQIPFDQVGGKRCEIVCERGLAAVPMLVPVLNATLLARGHLPLHAAAFVHRGRGVVATGWSKGGKTETLLAFMANGARYVADEWLYLAPGGTSMFGIPEPIRVWNWHLCSLPELRKRLSRGARARLALLELVAGGMKRVTAGGARHGSVITRTLNRASALVENQLCVDLTPERLFGGAASVNGSPGPSPLRPERVLFVVSHEQPEISVRPIDPREVAERMLFSLAEEDQRLVSCYHKFRYAFPGRTNEFLEHAGERRRALLHAALAGKDTFEVRHPYPVSLPALYRALAEVCS